ncbi:MAG: hypothetical protein ABIN67_10245 [Ferruginibacter sp.]
MPRFLFVPLVLMAIFFSGNIIGQDTLPQVSVFSQSGKVIISWKNTYGAKITNINIQRSSDSLKRFTTIGTVLNPLNRENGYVDSKPPQDRIFYRVFIAFEGGDYIFSKSHQPVIDTLMSFVDIPLSENKEPPKNPDPTGFVPSKFVFTGKDNNVIINLPDAAKRKFSIKFFDENDKPVFEINGITEPYLILEKVNFLHAGWFKYHLFDNNVLLEKFKFYIPKETRNGNGREQRNK